LVLELAGMTLYIELFTVFVLFTLFTFFTFFPRMQRTQGCNVAAGGSLMKLQDMRSVPAKMKPGAETSKERFVTYSPTLAKGLQRYFERNRY
jgi:cyanate permease